MSIYMPPIARKKQVPNKYAPNSYRVISTDAEQIPIVINADELAKSAAKISNLNIVGQPHNPKDPRPNSQHRHHRPHPKNIDFLRHNVKTMNEPVCTVDTTDEDHHYWWPSGTKTEPVKQPEYTLDSTSRDDFQYRGTGLQPTTRHLSKPNTTPADGIIPVHGRRRADGNQRFWKEGISYEHIYDCRNDPQYPIRAKRHGAFVWDEYPPSEVEKMLSHYGYENVEKNRKEETHNTDIVDKKHQNTNVSKGFTSSTVENGGSSKGGHGYNIQSTPIEA